MRVVVVGVTGLGGNDRDRAAGPAAWRVARGLVADAEGRLGDEGSDEGSLDKGGLAGALYISI